MSIRKTTESSSALCSVGQPCGYCSPKVSASVKVSVSASPACFFRIPTTGPSGPPALSSNVTSQKQLSQRMHGPSTM